MNYCNSLLCRSLRSFRSGVTALRRLLHFARSRKLPVLCLALLLPQLTLADISSATQAMEDSGNPLLLFDTSRGEIYIELLPREAPQNVANVLALVSGEKEIEDPNSGFVFRPNYYDGMRFHRVIPNFVIQTGAAVNHPLGTPGAALRDEINADSLGLDRQLVLQANGATNAMLDINNRAEFESEVLSHLLADMQVDTSEELVDQQERIFQRLQSLSVKALYELQGYRYQTSTRTRAISRGTVVLANSGPDSNSAEFFIALVDSPSLTGKYTVIGRVAEGMEVADAIGATEIDPQRYSRLSTVIYSARQVNDVLTNRTASTNTAQRGSPD